MDKRTLGSVGGGLSVSALGLGCMGMSEFYGARDDAQSMETLNRALDLGVTFLDSADTYGLGHNEDLIGRLIAERGRDAVTIATKFGIQREEGAYARGINNDLDYIRSACEASLRRLGADTIDLYYVHRVNPECPIEETMAVLSDLVAEGKVRHVGLCEVSPDTLRRAHAVHPVTAVQSEYSLWTREPEGTGGLLETCCTLGIGFVAYSPLGRGFLTGSGAMPEYGRGGKNWLPGRWLRQAGWSVFRVATFPDHSRPGRPTRALSYVPIAAHLRMFSPRARILTA